MIAISISFLAGRFHATPWGRHVNEGVQEWPPAPWRLARTLVATWKAKFGAIPDDRAEHILRVLAEPPEYCLPPATAAHTRHYMPWDKTHPGHTTLVFDTFVVLSPNTPLVAVWPEACLEAGDRSLLADWLKNVGYLGRAESWCAMQLLTQEAADQGISSINCRPLGTRMPDAGSEIVRLLCLDPVGAFANTYTPKHTEKLGKGKTAVNTLHPLYEPDWHLCGETLWLHKEKWSDPPGSRWVRYTRPADCFKLTAQATVPKKARPRPQVIRYVLDSRVLPLVTETLKLAEDTRRNLMGLFGKQNNGAASEAFSGKSAAGEQLLGHGHAYFLPTDEDGDGRLDHLTLVSTSGFGPLEMKALDALREIKNRERTDSGHPVEVLLMNAGELETTALGPARHSLEWTSATPYLAHRHPKTRGARKDTAEELASPLSFLLARIQEDLARFLQRRPDLADISVEQIRITPCIDENNVFHVGAKAQRPIEFKRYRQKSSDDGGRRRCGGFKLTFPRPIPGPICLGHSSHFGMGLFLPD